MPTSCAQAVNCKMHRRRAAAKSKEREENARKFAEFSKRVEAEIPPLADDFLGVSRTATLTRYLIARQYDIEKALKARRLSRKPGRQTCVTYVLTPPHAPRCR